MIIQRRQYLMLLLNYKSFDELFIDINKKIISEPEKYIENVNWNQCYLPFTILESDTCECKINLADLSYTANKIKILSRTYIDKERLEIFKEHLKVCKGTSLTYYFKNIATKN